MLKLFSVTQFEQKHAMRMRFFKRTSTLASTVFAAAMLSACVGGSTDETLQSVLTPEQSQVPEQELSQAPDQAIPNSQIANQATTQPNAVAPTPQPSSNAWQPVPLGSRLPAPGTQVNYLENSSIKNEGLSQVGQNGIANNQAQANTITNVQYAPPQLERLNDPLAQNGLSASATTTPVIDPLEAAAESRIPALYNSITHGKCSGEWAPKPKRLDAKRITPGDPYYIEFRLRNTPLMPVGHTFVVYGKLDGNGEALTERMAMLAPLGGYAGAGLAAAIPVPGVLTPYGDDCVLRPESSYRVSLSAQRFERMLKSLKQIKKNKPVYMLFAQNCNHFTQAMADSVGVKPPKAKAVPAVEYLYDLIEANEGFKVNTKGRSNVVRAGDRITPAKT